eukprot:jgi/Chrzof1/11749/Cz06g08090.t1
MQPCNELNNLLLEVQVCLVGSRQFNTFGSHGSVDYVSMRYFPTIEACCSYLKDTQGCTILGVEIEGSAKAVHQHPFTGNTAFMLGNEGQGLSDKQMRLCDGFVYIPQYGSGTASLNVTVAASIVLHHFAVWADYTERLRQGAKFAVAERPQRCTPRGVVPLSEEEMQVLVASRQRYEDGEWMEEAMLNCGGMEGLFETVPEQSP